MAAKTFFRFLILALMLPFSFTDGDRDPEIKACSKYGYKICRCGDEGQKFAVPIKVCEKAVGRGKFCEPCNKEHLGDDICGNFKWCAKCIFGYKRCFACPKGRYGKFCEVEISNASALLPQLEEHQIFPIVVDIPPGQPFGSHRILRAQPAVCKIPVDSIDTAATKCVIYEDSVKCHLQCLWGYTFGTTSVHDISCDFKENVWKPSEFKECHRFVNCEIRVIDPGTVDCTSHHVLDPPSCNIECHGKTRSLPRNYVCNIDGSFTPPLPPCVEKDPSVITVKPAAC